jgi:trimethylamine-N-oxide reductase cytochrome c-type subunit TorC
MKLLIQILILCALFATAQAVVYVYVEEGVKLPLSNDVTLYGGTPANVVSEKDEAKKVVINGFVSKDDTTKLYATPNLKLLLASSKDNNIKVSDGKGSLEVEVSNDNLTDDSEEAWDLYSERFYEKCTQCHPAKVVVEHTMLEWEGLYGSMKAFAKPTPEDDAYISRFLRAFAKDGIVKEVE